MFRPKSYIRRELLLFFILTGVIAFGAGLSDMLWANYFKDAYNVDEIQRAFLEFPRELPGILCVFVIGALSFLGDMKIVLVSQVLSLIGIAVLGLITPTYAVMIIFLFTHSLGGHIFLPLSSSVGMALSEPDKVGLRMGQLGSVKTGMGFFTGILVFIGFRMGFFSFKTEIIWVFILSAFGYLVAIIVSYLLVKETKKDNVVFPKKNTGLVFKKEYNYYYLLTVLHGVQKQIALVFGSWVIIDLLDKGADIMSLLIILSSFIGMFFFRYVGKWIDSKGIKFMMYVDALSFIFVYVLFGISVWLIYDGIIGDTTYMVLFIYLLFVLDRLSMQVGTVKSVYLRKIAVVPEDVTKGLSTGTALDHIVSIIAAQISGFIWASYGPHWVFYFAAFFSLGNLYVAYKIKEPKVAV